MRSNLAILFVFLLALSPLGCVGESVQSPETGELERYLDENPDAAARGGQGEPAGIGGSGGPE